MSNLSAYLIKGLLDDLTKEAEELEDAANGYLKKAAPKISIHLAEAAVHVRKAIVELEND